MEFDIAPPSTSVSLILGAIAILLVALAVLFVWLAMSAAKLSVGVNSGNVELKMPFYGRTIPLSQLELDKAQVTRIDKSSPLRPRIRTNGVGLPGYGVGWFKLKNGEKALLALTSREQVVYIPTRDGYSLLLSVRSPNQFLDQLRAASDSG